MKALIVLFLVVLFLSVLGCATKEYVPPKHSEDISLVFTNLEALLAWNGTNNTNDINRQ